MCSVRDVCLMMLLVAGLSLTTGDSARPASGESMHRYKMLSALEYSGESQFSNGFETILTVRRELLPDGKARYVLSPSDIGAAGGSPNPGRGRLCRELSFVIDRKTQHLSGADSDLLLMEKVTNQCTGALAEVTKENVGKTWKQAFDLQFLGRSGPRELKFTLTAMPLETQIYGELIAVRALSEPFFMEIAEGSVRCRMNCAYVFGSDFEDIFLSASVFRATTNANGFNESLKHTVATWKVDAAGQPANFHELGNNKDFEKFTSKLGMTGSLPVAKASPLPQWARTEGVRAAQVANMCAAISCEGAVNPVATIYMPVASTVGLQSLSESMTASTLLVAAEGSEAAGSAAGKGLKWWPPWANIGWNWPTAAWGTGLGVGGAAAGGAFQSEHHHRHRSPVTN